MPTITRTDTLAVATTVEEIDVSASITKVREVRVYPMTAAQNVWVSFNGVNPAPDLDDAFLCPPEQWTVIPRADAGAVMEWVGEAAETPQCHFQWVEL